MNNLATSRRLIVNVLGIICITIIGIYNKVDVSFAIASVAIGISAANAYQKKMK